VNAFEFDSEGNIPKDIVEELFNEKGDCGYNCYFCHHNKHGAQNEKHQVPIREDVCTIWKENKLKNVHTYKHDCESCYFLGTVNLNEPYNQHTKFDLYVCVQDSKITNVHEHSLIARYSSEPSEYASMHSPYLFDLMFSRPRTDKPGFTQFGMASDELHALVFIRWRTWLLTKVSEYKFLNLMYDCFKITVDRSPNHHRLMSDLGLYPPMKILSEEEWNKRAEEVNANKS
jgi:hypothetical protein